MTRWPDGIAAAGVSCGIKPGGALDLGLIAAAGPLRWAGTFTTNAAAAAPVSWSRALLGRRARAVVVNSGNANAGTGEHGRAAVEQTAATAAAVLGCAPQEILVASTGPIGIPLPVGRVTAGVEAAAGRLSGDVEPFARSIMTTDTVTKAVSVDAGSEQIVGVAKGAAMIAPNMATMLAFLVTGASVPAGDMQRALRAAVDRTFNRISIDACESTNDSVFLLSTMSGARVDSDVFAKGLESACASLAEQIVRDAEGGSKVLRVSVTGAGDDVRAAELARAIAASALWRSAVHGADPNWGRVLAALGAADRDLDLGRVEIAIGGEVLFRGGEIAGGAHRAASHMASGEVDLACTVGDGTGAAAVLSADMSPEYVALNAHGTT